MTASQFTSTAAFRRQVRPVRRLSAGIAAIAALIAELALTFDLDALVVEAETDPFRR